MASHPSASAAVCAPGELLWVCVWTLVCALHLTIHPPSRLELTEGKMGNNQRQIAVPPPAAACRTKIKGEAALAVIRRSLVVREQKLADGYGAEMMLADSAASVSVLGKIN